MSAGHAELHASDHFIANQSDGILTSPTFTKSTAFTREEREKLGLTGLLPYRVETIDEQRNRTLKQLRGQKTPLEKYIYLQVLRHRNETLFFNMVVNHFEECAPIVYTPTVGQACQKFSNIYRDNSGLFITKYDKGSIRQILDNWRRPAVDIIVVTDGSRILGLGDLGANGMGIPIGKLILYTAAAGFHPSSTLPITLDVGSNNDVIRDDDRYVGVPEKRTMTDEEYYAFTDEFMAAVFDKWPQVLVQFEDFSNDHCFDLLARYRNQYRCFNDDIQGTGAVIAAGMINAWKIAGTSPKDAKFVFLGAGSAGVGVANQIVDILVEEGVDEKTARRQFYFVDSKGLVASNRGDKLADHKLAYARDDIDDAQIKNLSNLTAIIDFVKPTALLGLSGQGGSFDEKVLAAMKNSCERPIIFALSNPTANAECTAEQAYKATDGKAIFASGSPFDPVTLDDGRVLVPGQGNNMYIFPGLGLGASLAGAKHVTNGMVVASVRALANFVDDEQLKKGLLYPPLSDVRKVSRCIAVDVVNRAIKEGEATVELKGSVEELVDNATYQPTYVSAPSSKL